jgi:hypothetical protein
MRLIIASALIGLALTGSAPRAAHAQGWLDSLFGNYDHRYGGNPWDDRHSDRGHGQYGNRYSNRSYPQQGYPQQRWQGGSPGSMNGPTIEHSQ